MKSVAQIKVGDTKIIKEKYPYIRIHSWQKPGYGEYEITIKVTDVLQNNVITMAEARDELFQPIRIMSNQEWRDL